MDGDGLPDSAETVLGTDPESMDSDGDMLDDWYEAKNGLDPLKPDLNDDGLGDYYEVTGVSLDLDGDGTANAWDADNDNDGVPDSLDSAPFSKSTVNDNFQLDIKTSGNPTYIDFQLRPKDAEHLKLPVQSWNWPDDSEGTMKDLDDSKDDVQIVPMLEVRLSQAPEQSQVEEYGIVIDAGQPSTWSAATSQQGGLGWANAGGGAAMADINGKGHRRRRPE